MFCHIVRNSYSALPLSTIINLNKAKRVERSLDCARDDNLLPSQVCCQICLPKAEKQQGPLKSAAKPALEQMPQQHPCLIPIQAPPGGIVLKLIPAYMPYFRIAGRRVEEYETAHRRIRYHCVTLCK